MGPLSGKLCQAQAIVSFETALSKGVGNKVHGVHTVCVNNTELDELCEIDKPYESTKGVDGETDWVLLGVTASIQQEAGSLGERGNTEVGSVASMDTSSEYPMTWDSKYWEIQDEVPGSQIEDVQGRVRTKLGFWREVLRAPDSVLDMIQSGYKLPLLYMPDSFSKGNHSSTQAHVTLLPKQSPSYLQTDAFKKLNRNPSYVALCQSLEMPRKSCT